MRRPSFLGCFPKKRSMAQLLVVCLSIYNFAHDMSQFLTTAKQEYYPILASMHPRIISLNVSSSKQPSGKRIYELVVKTAQRDEGSSPPPRELWSYVSHNKEHCEPIKDWQTTSFPTCNSLHEVGLRSSVVSNETVAKLEHLATRYGWTIRSENEVVLFKNHRMGHMNETYLERQRLDSLVMERLTSSPHVVNIYGHCGLSSITEYADGGTLDAVMNKWDVTPREKLVHAVDLAQSVADLHGISMVHRDLLVTNFVMVRGKLKLNDFHLAWFLRRSNNNNNTKATCEFQNEANELRKGHRDAVTRSPEELLGGKLTEKTDTYGVGALLFFVLTTSPMYRCESGYYCLIKNTLGNDVIRKLKIDGIRPKLPKDIEQSADPSIAAIRNAMKQAIDKSITDRPAAQNIADSLRSALSSVEKGRARLSCPAFDGAAKGNSMALEGRVYLAGLVRDASIISTDMFHKLVDLNCKYGFGIHIVGNSGKDQALSQYEEYRTKHFNQQACAPYVISDEPIDLPDIPNRVDRIAHLRDFQRDRLQISFHGNVTDSDVVILADLDLFGIPSIDVLTEEACKMIHRRDHDVVCATGLMHRPYGYYDTFATILKPDTFVYPMGGRLVGSRRGENLNLVRSDDVYGTVTQEHILAYFENEKHQTSNGAVPVKSCFGGMAFYRASKWFMPQCRYNVEIMHLMEYANKGDGRPCEHVAFHLCLSNHDPSTKLVVQPRLQTLWDEPFVVTNRLASGGNIRSGLTMSNGLVTVSKRASEGSRLVSGQYSLRINAGGQLVIERSTNGTSPEVVWSADTHPRHFHDKWSNMFLILEKNGLVRLIQQVQQVRKDLPHGACKVVDATGTSCRIEVWSSGVKGPNANYFLELGDDGSLRVMDTMQKVLWVNDDGWYNREEAESEGVKLDFFVAGFPKCGTTTLLSAFKAHSETEVPADEVCAIEWFRYSDSRAYNLLKASLNEISTGPNIKRGIKCPSGLSKPHAVKRLAEWFPETKLIIGVRHPVSYFQSFYNYRVSEINRGKLQGPIRSVESLIGSDEWEQLSTDSARYEQRLERLGKTRSKEYQATQFKVFLYSLEQLEDENADRKVRLQEMLGTYLGLKKELPPLTLENKNHFVGGNGFNETIDICDPAHDRIRGILVENGKKTQQWIRDEFLKSPDVTVANELHFNELLEQWGVDPCNKRR